MRLHHLEITAFGPFADTVAVDFDHLSDAGLFLLSGATGAGKTSVLDAVCFALYGDVPGDRNAAKRLRSDQAAPGVAPCVTLEATLSGTPLPDRPLARVGAAQEARHGHHHPAGLRSRSPSGRPGAWQPLSSRLDETGHLVTRLVGMNLTQFCQVAMLPQGGSRRSSAPGPRSATRCSSSCSAPAGSRTSSAGCATAGSSCAAGPRPPTGASPTW